MAQKTVLLVEDDADIRDIVQDVLEAEGYDVIPASHGRQALEFLKVASPPALVILDLKVPLVSGRSVLEMMRNDHTLSSVPIVVMSAITQEKPAGASAFLRKPFSLSSLFDAVHTFAGEQEPRLASA
jgi:DNA-binding response OmpR family regulator